MLEWSFKKVSSIILPLSTVLILKWATSLCTSNGLHSHYSQPFTVWEFPEKAAGVNDGKFKQCKRELKQRLLSLSRSENKRKRSYQRMVVKQSSYGNWTLSWSIRGFTSVYFICHGYKRWNGTQKFILLDIYELKTAAGKYWTTVFLICLFNLG